MSFLGDSFGGGRITLRHFSIGSLTLDVVVEESFRRSVSKTESAVESGAKISDHRIVNPHEIIIRGTVVNHDTTSFTDEVFPDIQRKINNVGLPVGITAVSDYTIATVNRYASTAKKYVYIAGQVVNTASKIPDVNSLDDAMSLLNDRSPTDDRITRIKNTLDQLAESEVFIELMTSMGSYQNIQIGDVSVVRPSHGSAEFQIYLSEMFTYDVEIVGGINVKIKKTEKAKGSDTQKPQGEKKTEKAKIQSDKPQNKGKTAPQKTKKSALKTIVDSAKGLL